MNSQKLQKALKILGHEQTEVKIKIGKELYDVSKINFATSKNDKIIIINVDIIDAFAKALNEHVTETLDEIEEREIMRDLNNMSDDDKRIAGRL